MTKSQFPIKFQIPKTIYRVEVLDFVGYWGLGLGAYEYL